MLKYFSAEIKKTCTNLRFFIYKIIKCWLKYILKSAEWKKHKMIEFQWGLCKLFKRASVIFSLIISFILTILLGFHKIPLAWLGQNSKCFKTRDVCLLKQETFLVLKVYLCNALWLLQTHGAVVLFEYCENVLSMALVMFDDDPINGNRHSCPPARHGLAFF